MAENKKDASPCPRLAITGRSGKYSVCRLEEHLLAQLRADRGGGVTVQRFTVLSLYLIRDVNENSDPEDSEVEKWR